MPHFHRKSRFSAMFLQTGSTDRANSKRPICWTRHEPDIIRERDQTITDFNPHPQADEIFSTCQSTRLRTVTVFHACTVPSPLSVTGKSPRVTAMA
jgi:hypothetical protein